MSRLPTVLALMIAGLVPASMLHALTPADRDVMGLTIAPFARPRLLAAHFLAALPLALLMRRSLGDWGQLPARIIAAVIVSGGMAIFVPVLTEMLDDGEAAFGVRVAFRTCLATILITAWLGVTRDGTGQVGWAAWPAAIVFSLLPPAMYASRVRDNLSREAVEQENSQRLTRAWASWECLVDLGTTQKFRGKNVLFQRTKTTQEIVALRAAVEKPLADNASNHVRFRRVQHLVSLGQGEQAMRVLDSLSESSLDVAFFRAIAAREAEDWPLTERYCQKLLARSDIAPDMIPLVLDNLAEALRKQDRLAEAERLYREAIIQHPKLAAGFQFKLGLIAADRLKAEVALEHFRQAEALDPKLSEVISPARKSILANSWSCFQLTPSNR